MPDEMSSGKAVSLRLTKPGGHATIKAVEISGGVCHQGIFTLIYLDCMAAMSVKANGR